MARIQIEKYKDDDLITLREAAAILGISESTFQRYREEGKIPYFRYSRRKFLYKFGDIIEFRNKSYTLPCDWLE